jgi:iron-sulfur cluster assembly protein
MITLTRSAILAARQKLVDRGTGIGIKIGIKAAGCSGYSYVLEFVDEPGENDEQLQYDNGSLYRVYPK